MNPDIISYTYRGHEVGVCRVCGARHDDDAWTYRVTCPACRPPGIDVEPHPLIGQTATRTDDVTGERTTGVIEYVQTAAGGHAMLGLDVDQGEHRQSMSAAMYFEIGEHA